MAGKFNLNAAVAGAVNRDAGKDQEPPQEKPPARQKRASKPTGKGAAPPAEDTPDPGPADPVKLTRRQHVPLPETLYRALKVAAADDDIDSTVRVRAMIELWTSDPRHRARVDKLAKQRQSELIKHRW